MRALCLVRDAPVYRRMVFTEGLKICGYQIVSSLSKPREDDLLVIWNRYGNSDEQAQLFERAGARVVVVENGYLGKSWYGDRWFAMSLGQHGGAGEWFPGGPDRWDYMNVPMADWKIGGKDYVILAQRGIGSNDVKSPDNWAERTKAKLGIGRIRAHPGKEPPKVNLADDLRDAAGVITWGSSAAFGALILGVPVWYDFDKWIGAPAALPLSEFGKQPPKQDSQARLDMFRRLSWAMWRAREVEDGTAFRHLLDR